MLMSCCVLHLDAREERYVVEETERFVFACEGDKAAQECLTDVLKAFEACDCVSFVLFLLGCCFGLQSGVGDG